MMKGLALEIFAQWSAALAVVLERDVAVCALRVRTEGKKGDTGTALTCRECAG